jgi:hypothetical protein
VLDSASTAESFLLVTTYLICGCGGPRFESLLATRSCLLKLFPQD